MLELRKQIIFISIGFLLLSYIYGQFFYMLSNLLQTLFSNIIAYGVLIIIIGYIIKLIKNKDYWFGTLLLLFAFIHVFKIVDGFLDIITTADAKELLDLITNFYSLAFFISCFIYGIKLIREKDYRFGIPILVLFLAITILLALIMFLSFIYQGLK